MDIYANPGHKVRYVNLNAGSTYDKEQAKKHLVFGAVYTVKHIEVYSWSSDVSFEEVPGIEFNTCFFEDV
jgi:hypothetical protein